MLGDGLPDIPSGKFLWMNANQIECWLIVVEEIEWFGTRNGSWRVLLIRDGWR